MQSGFQIGGFICRYGVIIAFLLLYPIARGWYNIHKTNKCSKGGYNCDEKTCDNEGYSRPAQPID